MKLRLQQPYRSIKPFEVIETPDFVVLTGHNGAGKTQLLTAINSQELEVFSQEPDGDKLISPGKYYPSQGLIPPPSQITSHDAYVAFIKSFWQHYSEFLAARKQNSNLQLGNFFNDFRFKAIQNIATKVKKDPEELSFQDLYDNIDLHENLDGSDIFFMDLSAIISRYLNRWDDNQFKQFKSAKGSIDLKQFSDEEFIDYYGEQPWITINKILQMSHLDYHLDIPDHMSKEAPFEVKIVNNLNCAVINFEELSSGEKVLMYLSLVLFNLRFDKDIPSLLLLDEPDASLHPSMIKRFLEIIRQIFVSERKIKVIITTHSPSTVALAPEESLYIVNKNGGKIEKVTKDRALGVLMEGVPSISMNYENRRQVFVESHNDVEYYGQLHMIYHNRLQPEVSLNFIASGESRTDKFGQKVNNCEQVVNITDTLRSLGNRFILGIIDRDEKNQSTDYIKVLGEGNRYNIENYLFDPLLLGLLLWREKFVREHDFDLQNVTYPDVKAFGEEKLQLVADFAINCLSDTLKTSDDQLVDCKLINGMTIKIPSWYLNTQGHKLEDTIMKKFPQLDSIKKKKEELLKLAIINKVIQDFPGLLSVDILVLMEQLQR